MPLFVEFRGKTRTFYPGERPYFLAGARGSTFVMSCDRNDQSSTVFSGDAGAVRELPTLKHLEEMRLKALTGRVRLMHITLGAMECPICVNNVPVALATKHVSAHLSTGLKLLPAIAETTKVAWNNATLKLLAHAQDHPIISSQGAAALRAMDDSGLY